MGELERRGKIAVESSVLFTVANANRISTEGTERSTLRDPAAISMTGGRQRTTVSDETIRVFQTDDDLVEAVAGFIGPGLRAVEGGIVLAPPAHRRAIAERLLAQGIDVTDAIARRQYISLDAEAALATFMVDNLPNESLFRSTIGYVITRMLSAGFRVRVYCGMSSVLCGQENVPAATSLNQLWSDLGKRRTFSLFRAYPAARLPAGVNDVSFQRVLPVDTAVAPVS